MARSQSERSNSRYTRPLNKWFHQQLPLYLRDETNLFRVRAIEVRSTCRLTHCQVNAQVLHERRGKHASIRFEFIPSRAILGNCVHTRQQARQVSWWCETPTEISRLFVIFCSQAVSAADSIYRQIAGGHCDILVTTTVPWVFVRSRGMKHLGVRL